MTTVTHERRNQMVETQLAARGILDDRVLQAMRELRWERFVAPELVEFAYRDSPLPIEADQTISQPYIVALMAEALDVQATDRVLEVGAGSGYAAAVLSRLAERVVAVERHGVLAEGAEARLRRLGLGNVEVVHADGTLGWEPRAPYDAILVSAGGSEVPQALLEQLAPGGRLLMPVGEPDSTQELVRFRKDVDGNVEREELGAVRFVPLVASVAYPFAV